jgi:hypothetical protein
MVVVADASPPAKPGRFVHRRVLLEASYLSRAQLRSADSLLGQHHLAALADVFDAAKP